MNKELAQDLEPSVPQEEIDAGTQEAAESTQEEQTQEPAESQKAEAKPEEKKVVPYAALHEERMKRKELQAEIARERQEQAAKQAVIQDRLNQMWAAQ